MSTDTQPAEPVAPAGDDFIRAITQDIADGQDDTYSSGEMASVLARLDAETKAREDAERDRDFARREWEIGVELLNQSTQRVKVLEAALKIYGQHQEGCTFCSYSPKCSCGLSDIIYPSEAPHETQ